MCNRITSDRVRIIPYIDLSVQEGLPFLLERIDVWAEAEFLASLPIELDLDDGVSRLEVFRYFRSDRLLVQGGLLHDGKPSGLFAFEISGQRKGAPLPPGLMEGSEAGDHRGSVLVAASRDDRFPKRALVN